MPWLAAIAAPIVGGIMGQESAAADRKQAMQLYQDAQAQFANVNVPDEVKQQLTLQSLTQQGTLTPEQIQQVSQGASAMGGISTDPRLQQAQMNALSTMSKMGQTGLQSQDMAALNASRRQVAGDEQAKDQSIQQNLAARGASGGGLELATRLAANQGAANTAAQQSDQTMAMAQNRMLQATAQAGQLGGQMQGQQFNQQAQQASAQDAISRFNAQQAAATGAANVNANNAAQAANLAAKQSIANANVGTSNAQQQYNKNLANQNFNQQMTLAGARAGQNQNMGNALGTQANATAGAYANMGAGAGQMALGAAKLYKPGATTTDPTTEGWANGDSGSPVTTNYTGMNADNGMAHGGVVTTEGMEHPLYGGGFTGDNYKDGGNVPGHANVPGDDAKNDTVKAVLSPGEIVIPRSHTISKELAKAYLDHLFKVSKGEK